MNNLIKNKLKIENNFYVYQFPEDPQSSQGYNVLVLCDSTKALLIDTGLESNTREVLEDLQQQGIEPATLIITHFHHDHIGGISLLDTCRTIGSGEFMQNLSLARQAHPRIRYTGPEVCVTGSYELLFGKFEMILYPTPGHCRCSLSCKIKSPVTAKEYIHGGDLIMADDNGKPSFPLVCVDGDIDAYRKNLAALQKEPWDKLFTGHGTLFDDREKAIRAIETYMQYLGVLNEFVPGQTPMQVFKPFAGRLAGINFHFMNLKNISNQTPGTL